MLYMVFMMLILIYSTFTFVFLISSSKSMIRIFDVDTWSSSSLLWYMNVRYSHHQTLHWYLSWCFLTLAQSIPLNSVFNDIFCLCQGLSYSLCLWWFPAKLLYAFVFTMPAICSAHINHPSSTRRRVRIVKRRNYKWFSTFSHYLNYFMLNYFYL